MKTNGHDVGFNRGGPPLFSDRPPPPGRDRVFDFSYRQIKEDEGQDKGGDGGVSEMGEWFTCIKWGWWRGGGCVQGCVKVGVMELAGGKKWTGRK